MHRIRRRLYLHVLTALLASGWALAGSPTGRTIYVRDHGAVADGQAESGAATAA